MTQEFISTIILGLILILGVVFFIFYIKDYIAFIKSGRGKNEEKSGSPLIFFLFSGIVNFFDTLGIGSFAPAIIFFRKFKLVDDRVLPGTLNTAFTIPVIVQALFFIREVHVDTVTLISMIISATIGAIFGAHIVSKFEIKQIRISMSISLGILVFVMLAKQLDLIPFDGDAIGLRGIKLLIGIIGNFILGALVTLGIGFYAPCLALVCSLGLNPLVAFPIMMGSSAFLLPFSSICFIKEDAYNRKATFFSILGGIIGVIIAATFIKSLPIDKLIWLIIVVIGYTSIKMLIDSQKEIIHNKIY